MGKHEDIRLDFDGLDGGGMVPYGDGDYVGYEDYVTLAAEKELLKKQRDAALSACATCWLAVSHGVRGPALVATDAPPEPARDDD